MAIVFVLGISLQIRTNEVPSLLLLSLGGFAGSLYLFLKGMKKVGVAMAVMIFSTSSIYGVVFAVLFLHEDIDLAMTLLSLFLTLTGVFFVAKDE